MIEHLDEQEVTAVLAHELGHIVRRDYLLIVIATILRDAFFYLPTSRVAHRQLHWEKELVCDDLTVATTQRPLALASALTRVWLAGIERQSSSLGGAQALVETEQAVRTRVERLLAPPTVREHAVPKSMTSLVSLMLVFTFLVVLGAHVIILLILLGCNPFVVLGHIF